MHSDDNDRWDDDQPEPQDEPERDPEPDEDLDTHTDEPGTAADEAPPTEVPSAQGTEDAAPDPTPAPVVASPVWDPRAGRWVRPDHVAQEAPRQAPAPAERRGGTMIGALIGALVGALLAGTVVFAVTRTEQGPAIERRLDPGIPATDADTSAIVAIAEKARPWVVNVNVRGRRSGGFGSRIVQGTGSGVIIRSDGFILTNAHVVEGANDVEVVLSTGETIPAEVVGSDPETDVAVLEAARGDLPAAVLGTAGDLQVGELAVAIGSPLGLEQSVTAGIVSALGRTVTREGQPPLVDMIQTDAAITQGNSGGALLDGSGAVVGINTAIAASPDVGAEGIAFAIPIDIARAVAEELIETGEATHPWIGIQGTNIDAETARRSGIGQGARIIDVVAGSPADEAGLQPGDIIVGIAGETVTTMEELIIEIRRHRVGETVPVEVVRDGETISLDLTIGDRPDSL